MRRKTWQPSQPEEIVRLVLDREKHFVHNGEQLLEVILASLARLELELHGETPAVADLWYPTVGNNHKPKDENPFSDYVKRFLDRDLKSRGIIINREVELRCNSGGQPGERTDIHVDAVVKSPNGETHDSITVIIEVKGCWHREVMTAMETQLVDRYLANNANPYGLYLVGWFTCTQWDNNDGRKNSTPRMTIDEAKQHFDTQAEQLSSASQLVRACVIDSALR